MPEAGRGGFSVLQVIQSHRWRRVGVIYFVRQQLCPRQVGAVFQYYKSFNRDIVNRARGKPGRYSVKRIGKEYRRRSSLKSS